MDYRTPKSTEKKRHYCCICSNYRGKIVNGRKTTLHRFPIEEKLRKAWIRRLKTVSTNFILKTNDRLCSEHFVNGSYDKTNPVPNIFVVNGARKIFKTSKMEFYEPLNTNVVINSENVAMAAKDDTEKYENNPLRMTKACVNEHISCLLHDYVHCHDTEPANFLNKETQTENTVPVKTFHNVSTQTTTETSEISTQTDTITFESKSVQIEKPELVFEDTKHDRQDVMFYTGIPDAETFVALFEEMNDIHSNDNNNGRPRSLRLIDEFFMTLMRLRLGLLIRDLAQRFHISKSTCGDTINRWIDYLSVKLSFLTAWPPKQMIKNMLPSRFRKYANCRVIIDCTEIYTETPQSLKNRSLMYSNYKSHMTYKSLIGISPNGVITFVSDLWGGSISDKQLTKSCGLLDLLEPGDQVMADKGFLISDLLSERGIQLIIPPLKNKKFMRQDIEQTRRIANLRIYVEMAIERIKNFRIMQGIMPITLSQQVSQIWKICAALTNLQPPLVKKE